LFSHVAYVSKSISDKFQGIYPQLLSGHQYGGGRRW